MSRISADGAVTPTVPISVLTVLFWLFFDLKATHLEQKRRNISANSEC